MPVVTYILWDEFLLVNWNILSWLFKSVTQTIAAPTSVRLFGTVVIHGPATNQIQVNRTVVWEEYEPLWDRSVPIDLDVTGLITPGDNTFTIGVGNFQGGTFTLSAQITYEGTQPTPPQPRPEPPPLWQTALYIGLGLATVGVIAYTIQTFKPVFPRLVYERAKREYPRVKEYALKARARIKRKKK